MKVAAARLVDEPLWYPIAGAQLPPGVPMIVMLSSGFEVQAVVRKHPRRKRWWWYQVGTWGGDAYGWIATSTIELDMAGRDPPSDRSPVAFRPIDPARWPRPLPPPLATTYGPNRLQPRPNPEAEALDPHRAHDGWPYPGLVLGERTGPRSLEECEARLLRAFRTSASNATDSDGHRVRSTCADIPGEFVKIALRYAERERQAEEFHRTGMIKPDSYDAVRSGWTPNRRDLGDWDHALTWLNAASEIDRAVVPYRAADPPFGWREIGGRERCDHKTAKARYRRALAAAFETATRGTS